MIDRYPQVILGGGVAVCEWGGGGCQCLCASCACGRVCAHKESNREGGRCFADHAGEEHQMIDRYPQVILGGGVAVCEGGGGCKCLCVSCACGRVCAHKESNREGGRCFADHAGEEDQMIDRYPQVILGGGVAVCEWGGGGCQCLCVSCACGCVCVHKESNMEGGKCFADHAGEEHQVIVRYPQVILGGGVAV
jgi:hypothetical protein